MASWLTPWRKEPERTDPALSMDQWVDLITSFNFQGIQYSLPTNQQEEIGRWGFGSLVRGSFKGSAVVFACMQNRAQLFSEARFAYQRIRAGRPQELWGDATLSILEEPWAGATTGDLLTRMIQYADLGGNAYVVRRGNRLAVLRPDWVTLIGGIEGDEESITWDADAEVLGYIYEPGGPGSGREPVLYLPEQVAHFAPIPDPEHRFLGMSWLTPVLREVMADKAATEHKLAFFENGATPNLVIQTGQPDLERFRQFVDAFNAGHAGAANAYKTLFLAEGGDATVVGTDLQQLDFKVTQGAGETRIAAAAGVPPVIVGLSEGLAAATYSNYGQARRRFADQTMRPLWRNVAGSLERIITVQSDSRLWYDDRDVSALQEDQRDAAEVTQFKSTSMKTLVDAGYTPESVVAAVDSGDLTLLAHSGLVSVQLQPPGTEAPAVGAGEPTPEG